MVIRTLLAQQFTHFIPPRGPINSVRSCDENNSGLTVDNQFILGFMLIMKAITYLAFQAEQANRVCAVLSKSELRDFHLKSSTFGISM